MTDLVERLRNALSELYAMVNGECPSLLDEDRGGCARLDLEIEELLSEETATALEAKDKELAALRAKLFPYADAHEISGMSWSGFYLIGDKKSIAELRRLENRSAQLEQYSAAYEERIAVAEARAETAERRVTELEQDVSAMADEIQRLEAERAAEWGRCREAKAKFIAQAAISETLRSELDASNANHRAMAKQLADLGRERDVARAALKPFAEAEREFSFAIGPDGIDDDLSVAAYVAVRSDHKVRLSTRDFSRAARAITGED